MRGQNRGGHLVGRTADIERGAGQPVAPEGREQRALVHQVAARGVHEEGAGFHRREGPGVHQVLGLLAGDGKADDEVGGAEELRERHAARGLGGHGGVGIGDEHLHAERAQQAHHPPARWRRSR